MGHPVAIEVRNVSKRYSDDPGLAPALDNVSVDIADNEFFTLLGPSGCGKTTLLRTIAGFEHVSEGEIRLAGEPVNDLPPFKRRVNTVFQSYALFPHMSVAQNIAFGLEMQGLDRKLIPQRVDEMLALVQMPSSELGSFLTGIPAPLGLGKVQLADGRWESGFICEAYGLEGAVDISHLGGWRAYLKTLA